MSPPRLAPTSRSWIRRRRAWSRVCTSSARMRSDDWHPGRSDIDIVAVLAEPATDDDFGDVENGARTAERAATASTHRRPVPGVGQT